MGDNPDWNDSQASDGADSYTETTHKSWFGRMGDALGAIVFGLILLLGGVALLFWNEGRAVATAQSLTEGAKKVVEAKSDAIDAALEGKLIHVTGPIVVKVAPRDSDFGVTAAGVRLERKVEMFSWKETSSSRTEKKLGGGEDTVTTYSYAREWSDHPMRSVSFKQPQGHFNPPAPIHSQNFSAEAELGAYKLTPQQAGGLGAAQPSPLEEEQASLIGARLGHPAHLLDGAVFVGADPQRPQIGDLRISYEVAKVDEASFVAAQKRGGLAPFATRSGEVFLSRDGDAPASEMFKEAEENNVILTWVLRLVGFVLLFIAFRMIMSLVGVLTDVVPLFGDLVGFGLGLVAMVLGGALALLVIGVAWIFYRPILGLSLIAGALLLGAGLIFRSRGAGGRNPAGPRAA